MADGPNLFAQGIFDQKQSGGDDKDGPEGWMKRFVVATERVLQAVFSWLPKMSGAGENSMFAGMDPKAAVDLFKTAPAPLSGLAANGGGLAKLWSQIAKLDLSSIKGLPVESISPGALFSGETSPLSTGGGYKGGMDFGNIA